MPERVLSGRPGRQNRGMGGAHCAGVRPMAAGLADVWRSDGGEISRDRRSRTRSPVGAYRWYARKGLSGDQHEQSHCRPDLAYRYAPIAESVCPIHRGRMQVADNSPRHRIPDFRAEVSRCGGEGCRDGKPFPLSSGGRHCGYSRPFRAICRRAWTDLRTAPGIAAGHKTAQSSRPSSLPRGDDESTSEEYEDRR